MGFPAAAAVVVLLTTAAVGPDAYQLAVSRARAPWSVTPCIELSRRVPAMPNSKFILPRCNTVRP